MNNTDHKLSFKKINNDQKGMVLIITLSLLAILTLTGTIIINSINTDIKISSNFRTSKQAFYAAEAGTEEARERLSGGLTAINFIGDTAIPPYGSWSTYLSTYSAGNAGWLAWLSTNDPNYSASYTNNINDSRQTAIPFWVKVRHKREFDAIPGSYVDNTIASDSEIIFYGFTDPSIQITPIQFSTSAPSSAYAPVEIITAYGSSSTSVKNIEIEVVRDPGLPAVATFYSNTSANTRGSSIDISGIDSCGNNAPQIGTIYTKDPGATTPGGGSHPTYSTPPVSGPIDLDIAEYIARYMEDFIDIIEEINNPRATNISDWGSSTNHKVFHYNPTPATTTLDLKDTPGFGLLMVEGDLEIKGNVQWTGLVLVTGKVTCKGGGNRRIEGAVYAGGEIQLNGNITAVYNSCAINNLLNLKVMRLIKWNHMYQ